MPGSQTTRSRSSTCDSALSRVAFRSRDSVGAPNYYTLFEAQWPACACPCRRFIDALTATDARLGVDMGRYSFIVEDFHSVFLAGLPAHHDCSYNPKFAGSDSRPHALCGQGHPI
jgi:hypothetical protein